MRSRKRELRLLKGARNRFILIELEIFLSFFFCLFARIFRVNAGISDDCSSTRYYKCSSLSNRKKRFLSMTPLSPAAIKIEIPSPSFITLSSHCFGRPLIPPDSSPTCHYPVRDQGRPYPSFPLQLYPYTNFNSPPIWPCP